MCCWVFQPIQGTTCLVMGVSGSVTTSFPPPVIHDSDVFFLPRFMLTPSYVFTPSIMSHLSFFHSLLRHHLVWFMEWVGILTEQLCDVLCTISFPLKAPFSWAKPTRRAAGLIIMQLGDRGAFQGERSRLQHCTSASYFFALDYYERVRITTTQTQPLREREKKTRLYHFLSVQRFSNDAVSLT